VNDTAVILVETSESLNIGSVSRSMMNFGFSDLRLVAPERFQPERAAVTACGARGPLESVRVFETPRQAIADRDLVVGFSGRQGKNLGQNLSLMDWLESTDFKSAQKLGLLFGPEDNGLRQEHIEQCSAVVSIPTSSVYPSMNLAHAVAIILFMISQRSRVVIQDNQRVEWSEFEQLDSLVQSVATYSGFFHKGTPQPVPSVIKSLFRRLSLSKREMAILLGLFGTANKALEGKVPVQRTSEPSKD